MVLGNLLASSINMRALTGVVHPRIGIPVFIVCCASSLLAQVALTSSGQNGPVRIFYTDQAVLEAGETRKDLPCTVNPNKPLLGFDMRYHSGYDVNIPLRDLAGSENMLTILFRVSDLAHKEEPLYFSQKIRVPSIEDEAKGDAYLQGTFDVGVGNYHVDWLMRDRAERICSFSWDVEAALPNKDKQIELAIPPGTIQPADREQFKEEPPVVRNQDDAPLNVKVMINFAPQNSEAATLQPLDTAALVSILRGIARDPRIGKFSIVAFNLQEQKIVYRSDNAEKIDFPALGDALTSLNLGTIDLRRLSQKHGDTEFLTNLIRKEVTTTGGTPDALVFAGPKAMLDENVPQESLREIGSVSYPVFYMNYNLYPQQIPWNDAIGKAVKFFKGYEYTISKPRDLWYAVSEMVSRIAKSRAGRRSGALSSE